jgi:hypothetical protein
MSPKRNTEEAARKKLMFWHYAEETMLLIATVAAIIMADALQKLMKGVKVDNADVSLNIVNVVASSILAVVVYGKRYSNFKEVGRTKPAFLLRLSDAIIYGIGFKGIVGIGTGGGK